jgi:hypothetical protein
MATYTKHDYHKDWVAAKKKAKLADKLFQQKLGGKLDELNKLYDQLAKATPKNWKTLYDQHSNKAIEIQKIVKAYRDIVNANGKNAEALKVLENIDASKKTAMIWAMALDKGSWYTTKFKNWGQ